MPDPRETPPTPLATVGSGPGPGGTVTFPGPNAGPRGSPAVVAPAPTQGFEATEHHLYVVKLRRIFLVGVLVWPGFAVFDWLVVTFIEPGDLVPFLALRGVGALVIAAALWRFTRRPEPGPAVLCAIDVGAFTAVTVLLTVMCLDFRGIASPYSAGVSVVLVARGSMIFRHWREGAWQLGLPAAAHPLVLGGCGLVSARVGAQFRDPAALAGFALNCCLLASTWLFLVYGGHTVWALRRNLFETRTVGRYQLRRRLGVGGMGEVWVAFDRTLKREVALKVLRPELSDEANVRRFRREFDATAKLAHPNTVRLFDYGVTDDGLWYYAMELLPGATLKARVAAAGPLPAGRAVRLFSQVGRALAEAHAAGIVHRDVKPDNIIVSDIAGQEVGKLVDFGIAKVAADPGDGTLTRTGWVGGTPAYMSPEQARGEVADARSDVYSLGLTLYFALAGRLPFGTDDPAALLYAQVNADPAPLPVSPDLDAVVRKCVAKSPADRYQSAAEFAAAVEALPAGPPDPPARRPDAGGRLARVGPGDLTRPS